VALEAVVIKDKEFLSGLMQMGTGHVMGLENKMADTDQTTAKVIMLFKRPRIS